MFQMSTELFHQCWPLLAAQIKARKYAKDTRSDTTQKYSSNTAVEASYMLGVAIGYALKLGCPTSDPASTPSRQHRLF